MGVTTELWVAVISTKKNARDSPVETIMSWGLCGANFFFHGHQQAHQHTWKLVGGWYALPLWKMMELKSVGMMTWPQYDGKNNPHVQFVTRIDSILFFAQKIIPVFVAGKIAPSFPQLASA